MRLPRLSIPKLSSSATYLSVWLAMYFAFILNIPFLKLVFQLYEPIGTYHDYFVYTVPIVLCAACCIIFQILNLPYLHKILMPIFILISAAISYNTLFFNVYFNRDMLDNVLQTTPAETMRMMSFSYVMWLIILGVLPALAYIWTRAVYHHIWWREILRRLSVIVVAVGVILGVGALFYQDYASFFRNHDTLKHVILPSNFVGASISKIKRIRKNNLPYQALGQGAKMLKTDGLRNVTVLVVGETTRAQNWGLNGYEKQTTPKLAARLARGETLVNFPNVQSCGTATAVSVPCLFSSLTRDNYDEIKANRQDNLLDTLKTAGVNIVWLNNNSDCKGVCRNVASVDTIEFKLPEFCRDGECLDNIMLPELDKALSQTQNDTVVVLHTMGSHGPTYFERYTAAERLFTPTCDTKEINRCNNAELVNTYDNTIVYLDQFLDKIITKLAAHSDWKSTVFYVSDHGESLGENGVYLHGTPYVIAPKVQTSVPMMMWLSPTWLANKPFDLNCLREKSTQAFSHDYFFHTVFSLADMDNQTLKQYDPKLDILASCRTM